MPKFFSNLTSKYLLRLLKSLFILKYKILIKYPISAVFILLIVNGAFLILDNPVLSFELKNTNCVQKEKKLINLPQLKLGGKLTLFFTLAPLKFTQLVNLIFLTYFRFIKIFKTSLIRVLSSVQIVIAQNIKLPKYMFEKRIQ